MTNTQAFGLFLIVIIGLALSASSVVAVATNKRLNEWQKAFFLITVGSGFFLLGLLA